jgi:ABC-type antimicrobial peptide transport system permease subunit
LVRSFEPSLKEGEPIPAMDLGALVEVVGVDVGLFNERHPEFKYNHVEPVDKSKAAFAPSKEDYVPIIISKTFVDLMNTLAGGNNPFVEEFRKYIKEGQTFFIALDDDKAYRCKIVSEDNSATPYSVSVPYQYAEEWQKEQKPNDPMPNYSRFVVEANDIRDLDTIKEDILLAGYQPDPTPEQKLSISVSRGATYLFAVAVTFCLIIALVSSIGIFNGLSISIMEQAPRIGILRSVGATRSDISSIYLIEAAIIGVVGCLIGIVAAHLFMWGSDIALKDFLADVTNLRGIETLFVWDFPKVLYIRLGAIGLGVFASLFAGVGPAYRASRLNPAVVLRAG